MNENKDIYLSENIINGFESLEYTLEAMNYPYIYRKIYDVLPKEMVRFDSFNRKTLIACEVICAAICHKINWDFLRDAVYKKTQDNQIWLIPYKLEQITVVDVENLLKDYEKKERIMAKERCMMLRNVGKRVKKLVGGFEGIFIDTLTMEYRNLETVMSIFESMNTFSSDPQQKKMQLLFQSLSDYDEFAYLNKIYKPTIDYHLIRLYLRRGVVKPTNQYALDFIFNQNTLRKENTVATLRKVCSESLEMLSWISSFDLKSINRIEWWIGRTICVNGVPDCYLQTEQAKWLKSTFIKCPFYDYCFARQSNEKFLEISEPAYNGSSY